MPHVREEPRFEVLKVFVGVEEGRSPPSYEQVAQSLRVGVGKVATHPLNAPPTIQTHILIDHDCAASTHITQFSDIGE